MRRRSAITVVSLILAGCGTGTTVPVPHDDPYHVKAVAFQTTYRQLHNVDAATAECAWAFTRPAGGQFSEVKVLGMTPRQIPGGVCRGL
jgi:hypothetical protein